MIFAPVKSTNIHSVAYDPAAQILEVKFHGGGHHRYFDVSPRTHQDLMGADSVGRFFVAHVRGQHRSEAVKAPKA